MEDPGSVERFRGEAKALDGLLAGSLPVLVDVLVRNGHDRQHVHRVYRAIGADPGRRSSRVVRLGTPDEVIWIQQSLG